MNGQVARLLQQMHDPNYKEQLPSNTLSIVSILGGLENVVTLCLTHPDTDKDYCDQVISSMTQLSPVLQEMIVNDNCNIHKSSDDKAKKDDLILSTNPEWVRIRSISPVATVTPIATATTPTPTASNSKKINKITVDTPIEYYTSGIIFTPDGNNNLYFKWLSDENARYVMHFTLNKWYSIGCVALGAIGSLLTSIIEIIYGSKHVGYSIVILITQTLITVFSVSLILSMNLDIIKIISLSFDFWFKIWNLIIWELSFMWIKINLEDHFAIDLFAEMLGTGIIFLVIFTIDGLPLDYNIKRKNLFVIAIVILMFITFGYFMYDDIYINPLGSYNFQHTRMSVKSLHLGAYINVGLFVAKPILGDSARWLLIRYLRWTKSIRIPLQNDNDNQNKSTRVERFVSLYKRSKVKWEKMTIQ